METLGQGPHPIFDLIGRHLYDEVEFIDGEEVVIDRYCLMAEAEGMAKRRLGEIDDPAEWARAVSAVRALARFVERQGYPGRARQIEALIPAERDQSLLL